MNKICKNSHSIALLVAGIFCIIRGGSYLPFLELHDQLPRGLEIISVVFTIYFWALVWVVSGFFIINSALKGRKTDLAWGLASGIMIAWGFAYIFGVLELLWTDTVPQTMTLDIITRDIVRCAEYVMAGAIIGLMSKYSKLAVNRSE